MKGDDIISRRRILGNSLCPCGSDLRYKECCGKGKPITGNIMSFVGKEKTNPTAFEQDILEYTGHYSDDYIKPIEKKFLFFTYLWMNQS